MERSLYILMVDDEEIIHKTIADYLRDSGYRVDRVHGKGAILDAIGENDYDLVLFDLRTPGVNGFPILAKMQEIRPGLPLIAIVENRDMNMAIEALKLGAVDFLKKPIRLLELDAVLEKFKRDCKSADQQMQDMDALRRAYQQLQEQVREQMAELAEISEKLQTEINERRQAEKILQEIEARYSLLAENATDGIWITDMDLRITYANPAMARMLGYEVEDIIGLTQEKVLTFASLETVKDIIAEGSAMENKERKKPSGLWTVEMELVCKDESILPVDVKYAFLRDPDRRSVGLLGILSHITEEGEKGDVTDQLPNDTIT